MPAAPADGMVITVESTQIITALTLSGNTGQSIVGVPATLFANQPLSYVYRLSNTTWYPFSVARSAVLQVVSGITSSSYTTASSSPTATGYGLSITPSSSTSKILILLAGAMDTGVANNQAVVAVRRGATDLGNSSNNFSAANRMISGLAVIYLDSPATTSSTTYNIYFQAGSSSTITWYSGATLTLMEIAA